MHLIYFHFGKIDELKLREIAADWLGAYIAMPSNTYVRTHSQTYNYLYCNDTSFFFLFSFFHQSTICDAMGITVIGVIFHFTKMSIIFEILFENH